MKKMKRRLGILCLVLFITGCSNLNQHSQKVSKEVINDQANNESNLKNDQGDLQMNKLNLIIEGKSFQVELYQNDTVDRLIEKMPLTLKMKELNGNEKYNYLDFSLPTANEMIGNIRAGDIMLYGNNCLVLFYENFTTSYQYTRIGHVEINDIKKLVGNSHIDIIFQIN